LQKNADGSVEVLFGTKAPGRNPIGFTRRPGKPWVTLFRFYGPEQALLDKSWVLPDIEEVE
jgi:hypothetical protein